MVRSSSNRKSPKANPSGHCDGELKQSSNEVEQEFKLMNTWEAEYIPHETLFEDRKRLLANQCQLSREPFPAFSCTELAPMTLLEEFQVALSWFMFFSIALYGPFIIALCLYFNPSLGLGIICFGAVVAFLPAECNPSICFSSIATLNLKYFSYRAIWKETLPPDRPFIAVTPPHGLFPIGGILGIFAMPRFTGFFGHGIAAAAVLYVPFLGNLLRYLGCIEASKANCVKFLSMGESIGISSGGIAEIFETNTINAPQRVETIILKSRGGICKLALQTGVDIVPGYLFGNSTGFEVCYDAFGFMQWLSRKLRVSLVLFYGRCGLPVPHRIPVLAVFDSPIRVEKVENPSPEQVQALLDELIERVQALFDAHKASYGWEDVQLVVK